MQRERLLLSWFKKLESAEKSRFRENSNPLIHKVFHNSVEKQGPKML